MPGIDNVIIPPIQSQYNMVYSVDLTAPRETCSERGCYDTLCRHQSVQAPSLLGEIMSHAVWLYFCSPLSHRDVEAPVRLRATFVQCLSRRQNRLSKGEELC